MKTAYLGAALLFAANLVACSSEDPHEHTHPEPGGPALPSSTPIEAITFDALYVVNGGDGTITVVDPAAEAVAGTIALQNAPYPHHVNLSPDRALLGVAIPGADLSGGHQHGATEAAGAVLVLDALTGATVAAAVLDAMNHNAAFSADGTEIWTTQTTDPGAVLVLDAATLEVLTTIPTGSGPSEVTFGPQGALAFVANTASDDVTVIDAETKEVVATIAVGDGPVGAWPGSDGLMYVDNETGKSLSVIDPATLSVTRTLDLGFTPGYAAVSASGDLLVTDVDEGRLTFWDRTTGELVAATSTGPGAHAIALSDDGAFAYVTNQDANSVTVIDLATRTAGVSLPTGAKPNGIAFRAR